MRSLPIILAAASSFQLARATIFCANNPSHSFTFNNRSRDCDWLLSADQATRSNICSTDSATEQACPFSCSVCCKDNPFYRLYVNNANLYSCGDIGSNANLQELYCELSEGRNERKVKDSCPEACGYCPAPLIVAPVSTPATQTSLPTSSPTNLPAISIPTIQPSKSSTAYTLYPTTYTKKTDSPTPTSSITNFFDEEEHDDDLVIDKASSAEFATMEKREIKNKLIFIVVGSICSCLVILGLVIFARKGFFGDYEEDDNAESDNKANELNLLDVILNPVTNWLSTFQSSSDSDEFSSDDSYDEYDISETEQYLGTV